MAQRAYHQLCLTLGRMLRAERYAEVVIVRQGDVSVGEKAGLQRRAMAQGVRRGTGS